MKTGIYKNIDKVFSGPEGSLNTLLRLYMRLIAVFILGLVSGVGLTFFADSSSLQRLQTLHAENSMATLVNTYTYNKKTVELLTSGKSKETLEELNKMLAIEKSILEKCLKEGCAPGIENEIEAAIKP